MASERVSALSVFDGHLPLPRPGLEGNQSARMLQRDIKTIFEVIRDERRSARRLLPAAKTVIHARTTALSDELSTILHKLNETSLALHKNALYMHYHSKQYHQHHQHNQGIGPGHVSSSSSPPLSMSASTPHELQRLLLHPEHFPRGFQGSPLPFESPVATSAATQSSPWEGSEFKVKLLLSLKLKLTLSLYFTALKRSAVLVVQARQAAATCFRVRRKRLLRACFGSIVFELMSGRYIRLQVHLDTCAMPGPCYAYTWPHTHLHSFSLSHIHTLSLSHAYTHTYTHTRT
jgi:hypothetical protein